MSSRRDVNTLASPGQKEVPSLAFTSPPFTVAGLPVILQLLSWSMPWPGRSNTIGEACGRRITVYLECLPWAINVTGIQDNGLLLSLCSNSLAFPHLTHFSISDIRSTSACVPTWGACQAGPSAHSFCPPEVYTTSPWHEISLQSMCGKVSVSSSEVPYSGVLPAEEASWWAQTRPPCIFKFFSSW